MSPALEMEHTLEKRYSTCYYSNGRDYQCSTWNDWGRWVALVVIVVVVLLLAYMFSCLNNRRRRRRGVAPIYGTGWIPGTKPPGQGQGNSYYPQQPYNGGAAPPYSPPVGQQATGNTFNSNDGYYGQGQYGQNNYNPYGGQQSGVEMQPPQNSYQSQGQRDAGNVYQPPQGPPPTKGDGIIR